MPKKAKKKSVKKEVTAETITARRVPRRKPENYHLHMKKEQIMREVPVIPCTVIQKTRQGFIFAHTQAEEVYNTYREKCEYYGLVVRRIEGRYHEGMCPNMRRDDNGWHVVKEPCVYYEGVWEICDTDTGEKETFHGAGAGDNNIWSIMSAQTNARKQGLLDYFETCWPQPTDWLQVTQEYLQKLESATEMKKAIKSLLPAPLANSSAVVAEINKYFEQQFGKGAKS